MAAKQSRSKKKPLVSVIIPYWNAAKWIERCANSCTMQPGSLEFIFVNDSSTDNDEEIVKAFTDNRFVFVDNKYSKGVSGARNTGIEKAKGEWITFLDADDELVPEASAVFERMTRINETANIIQANHLRYYAKVDRVRLKYTNKRGVYHLLDMPFSVWPKCWCMVWNKLIRHSFIKENHIRFVEGLQYGEDEIFNLACCRYDDRLFHTKTDTVTVMRHFDNKESLSRAKSNDWVGLVEQSRALEDFITQTEDAKVRHSTYEILAEHWNSDRYRGVFGI